jgi:DNA-directed RNA polymerase subunit E'/Rpb7
MAMAAKGTGIKMSVFKKVYMDQRVALSPSEFSKAATDIDAYLIEKIRKKLEGQCCMHGYVRPGSTKMLARSMGQAEHGRFTGDFIFQCKIEIACLLPHANQTFECRILTMNKLGAYALIVEGGHLREAMRILAPLDLHLGNEEFDNLQVGQGIRVRLLRSRFQTNDSYIQGVGIYEGRAPAADAKEDEPATEESEGAEEAPTMVVEEVATAAT